MCVCVNQEKKEYFLSLSSSMIGISTFQRTGQSLRKINAYVDEAAADSGMSNMLNFTLHLRSFVKQYDTNRFIVGLTCGHSFLAPGLL